MFCRLCQKGVSVVTVTSLSRRAWQRATAFCIWILTALSLAKAISALWLVANLAFCVARFVGYKTTTHNNHDAKECFAMSSNFNHVHAEEAMRKNDHIITNTERAPSPPPAAGGASPTTLTTASSAASTLPLSPPPPQLSLRRSTHPLPPAPGEPRWTPRPLVDIALTCRRPSNPSPLSTPSLNRLGSFSSGSPTA